MSDIKIEVKEAIENFKIGKTANFSNKQLFTWLSCFLTTIESLQKESPNYHALEAKARYKDAMELAEELLAEERVITKSQKEEIEKLKSYQVIKNYTDMLVECNSLKAITELAVKGLREISDGGSTGEDARDMRITADFTLSEIERLSNAK